MNLKLGRSKPSRAKLQLRNYLGPALPAPPISVDWSAAMSGDYGMMLNDRLGCCVAAGLGHACQIITANGDGLITPTDDDILKMYEAISGYTPSDPSTDQGAMETTGMQFMVDHGLAGIRADAFADVNHTDLYQFKQSIALMGFGYIGVVITQADMDDFGANRAWQDLSTDNVLGGHALCVVGYDDTGISVITWGKVQNATWAWYQAKCDEAHACIFFPWVVNSLDTSPDGFNQAQLEADLKAL